MDATPAAQAANTGKKKVFIVEDDVFLVKAYQIKFEKAGFEVEAATDGKEAIARLEKAPPDIVILDLMLPGVSGFDILKAIRVSPTWKGVPVLILTNLGQLEDKQNAEKIGAQDYMVKAEVHINDVIERVKTFVNK